MFLCFKYRIHLPSDVDVPACCLLVMFDSDASRKQIVFSQEYAAHFIPCFFIDLYVILDILLALSVRCISSHVVLVVHDYEAFFGSVIYQST